MSCVGGIIFALLIFIKIIKMHLSIFRKVIPDALLKCLGPRSIEPGRLYNFAGKKAQGG